MSHTGSQGLLMVTDIARPGRPNDTTSYKKPYRSSQAPQRTQHEGDSPYLGSCSRSLEAMTRAPRTAASRSLRRGNAPLVR
jgi:hypothetical protein